MGGGPTSESTFIHLNETQTAVFNTDFHDVEELDEKFTRLCRLNNLKGDETFTVLDLGGGNGVFADAILARFSKSTVTVIDISSMLLSQNTPSNRKEICHGSIENISEIFAGQKFDYITANWVLHHLVGDSYQSCRENCIDTLRKCRELLKPWGMLIIAEHMFEGYLGSNLPSYLTYSISSIRWRWIVYLTQRFFNTASIGVCFQSKRAWEHIFVKAGFEVVTFQQGISWWWHGDGYALRWMAPHLLFVKAVSHGHFFLKPKQIS